MAYSGNPDQPLTPEAEREALMTVGRALKLAHMTIGQAQEVAYRDAELLIREMDRVRQAVEDKRSRHRNLNRLLVLIVSLTCALLWPMIMMDVFHSVVGTAWTTAVANTGDIGVTAYALKRRY